MVAPPVSAASSDLHPPCPSVFKQPTEKSLVSKSTLSQLGFPNEFPYEFDSSTFSSAFTSPGDSTESEDETSDDEDDFLAGLTRRLALSTQRLSSPHSFITDKAEVLVKPANSPESTLSGLGSLTTSGIKSPNGPFSQVPSPPESPFREEDSLKVISAAAGEVAKIKMANFDAKPSSRLNPNRNSVMPVPQNAEFSDFYYWQWQLQPALIAYPYRARGVFAAPTASKQPSAGTGVFLPRKYPNPSDSRKKSGSGCVKLPTKVVHPQHPKTEKFSGRYQSRLQACPSTGRSKLDNGTNSSIPNLDSQTQFPNLQ